jgi:hypothetical protein
VGGGDCTIYFIYFVERAAITFFLYIGDGATTKPSFHMVFNKSSV